jgi:inner membrane protein
MALPIAHATAGYLIHRLDRRRTTWEGWSRALGYMAIANLPDADFLVGFVLGSPGTFHRGVSHTVLAALVFGAAAATLTRWRWRDRWAPAAALLAVVYASHLLVDALTVDVRGPAGAQFFWPLSSAYYIAPVTIFHEILIDGSNRAAFVRSVVGWPAVAVLLREAVLALAAVTVLEVLLGWRPRAARDAELVPVLASDSGEEDLA